METNIFVFLCAIIICVPFLVIALWLKLENLETVSTTAIMVFIISIMLNIITDPYRQGQIDAINGKIKYELKTNPDSTKTWQYIEKEDENVKN